jgi:CDP-diacylglycerol--glycerol-3-phosphate 3-phosphatidyltransferase
LFTSVLQSWSRAQFRRVAALLANTPLTPNMLTLTGFALNLVVGLVIATGNLFWGAVLIFVAGVFDLLDGALAKVKNQMSPFGAFLDSFVDRYGEAAMYGGLLVYYLGRNTAAPCATCTDPGATLNHYFWAGDPAVNVGLLVVIIAGANMISYARARAGSLHIDCEVGLMPRTERVVLFALGLLLGLPTPMLWLLALGSQITALQRLFYVWEITSGRRAAHK